MLVILPLVEFFVVDYFITDFALQLLLLPLRPRQLLISDLS